MELSTWLLPSEHVFGRLAFFLYSSITASANSECKEFILLAGSYSTCRHHKNIMQASYNLPDLRAVKMLNPRASKGGTTFTPGGLAAIGAIQSNRTFKKLLSYTPR